MKETTIRIFRAVMQQVFPIAAAIAKVVRRKKPLPSPVSVDDDYVWAAALNEEFLAQCKGREVTRMEWNPTDGLTVTMYVAGNAPATTQINIPFVWVVQEKRNG